MVLKFQNSCGPWRTSVEAKQGTAIMGNARPMVLKVLFIYSHASVFNLVSRWLIFPVPCSLMLMEYLTEHLV